MTERRVILMLQAVAALAVIATVRAGWSEALLLAAIWLLPHGRLAPREIALFVGANALFVVMDASAIRSGTFAFSRPSLLGLAPYEPVMWGGYLLHVHRFWRAEWAPAARPSRARVAVVCAAAAAFGACFSLIHDGAWLFGASSAAIVIGIAFGGSRAPLRAAAHMALLGAAVEWVGVSAGEWTYPREPALAIPAWFLPMWAGVGFFFASLIFPLIRGHERSTNGGIDPCGRQLLDGSRPRSGAGSS
jgi:hypothetical protein